MGPLLSLRKQNYPNFVFLAVLPSLFLHLYFLFINREYPKWDPSEYLLTAFQAYETRGFISKIETIYTVRGWRPLLTPAWDWIMLELSGGRVILAEKLGVGILYFCFCIYLVFLLRKFLSGLSLLVAILFITTLPWLFMAFLQLFSEPPFLVCLLASATHFAYSRGLRSLPHSLAGGLFLGLASCFRPLETLLLLASFLFFFVSQRRAYTWLNWSGNLKFSSLVAFTIPVIWFAPFSAELMEWVISCTFGKVALTFAKEDNATFRSHLFYLLPQVPGIFVLALAVLACAGKHAVNRGNSLALLLCAFAPVLVGAATLNRDLRYFYAPGLFLAIFAIVIFLRARPQAALVICILFMTVHFTWIATAIHPPLRFIHPIANLLSFRLNTQPLAVIDLDACSAIFEKIAARAKTDVRQEFLINSVQKNIGFHCLVGFNLMAKERRLNWRFHSLGEELQKANIHSLKSKFDFAIIGPVIHTYAGLELPTDLLKAIRTWEQDSQQPSEAQSIEVLSFRDSSNFLSYLNDFYFLKF